MTSSVSTQQTQSDPIVEAGTVIDGRYRLDEVLGSGAMGTVYRGLHLIVGRPIALKVLSADLAASSTFRTRFRAEARAASAAGHPNIVEVFDAGEMPDGRPYIVMELLAGRELLDVLRREGPMAPERACRIIRDVARALHAAHEVGVIHRDLKAENVVLVERDGAEVVKVLDFGIAHGGTEGQRVTTPGLAMGTPEYMAPEQAYGVTAAPTFDIYALGVLLFELLVGEPPFTASNPIEILGKKASTPAPSVATRRQGLPTELALLVDACLELDPDARPRTADEVARRLDEIITVLTAPKAEAGHRLHGGGLLVALGVIGLGVLGIVWAAGDAERGEAIEAVHPVVDPRAELATATAGREQALPLPPVPGPLPTIEPPDAVQAAKAEAELVPPHRSEKRGVTRVGSETASLASAQMSKPSVDDRPAGKNAPAADSSTCQLRRRQAHEARDSQDWEGVLRHTDARSCWASARERDKLRVKAYMETHRFDRCIEIGRSSADPEVNRWVALCEKRMQ